MKRNHFWCRWSSSRSEVTQLWLSLQKKARVQSSFISHRNCNRPVGRFSLLPAMSGYPYSLLNISWIILRGSSEEVITNVTKSRESKTLMLLSWSIWGHSVEFRFCLLGYLFFYSEALWHYSSGTNSHWTHECSYIFASLISHPLRSSEDQNFLTGLLLFKLRFEFSFESESLKASLFSRLRILRTGAASEDSNLEVKKKSPRRSWGVVAARRLLIG